ncbi:MAG: competence/damage-inducible protein A [Candidatus Binatia bacterium]
MSAPLRTAAILATGDEIVGGRTVDTNSAWLADKLAALGIDVVAFMAVSDDVDRIAWAWQSAVERADLVISTGGLGPTTDDLTSETVAAVAGVPLELDEAQVERIREFFRSRGRTMSENNLRQAMIPAGAVVIDNPVGTAPGYRIDLARTGGVVAVGMVFPGVPREMKPMFETTALPWIAARTDPGRVVVSRTFSTFGLPESVLDQRLRGVVPASRGRLAFRASFPKISVRVSVSGTSAAAEREVEALAGEVRSRIAEVVYADNDSSMEQVVGQLLTSRGLRVATAESCTGGLIGDRLTDVAGSSVYYSGGIVAYSNDLKERVLGVNVKTLEQYGAVSEQTAREMATGALRVAASDIAVSTTGIAGPDGGTPDKPVGTVAIAIATRVGDGVEVDSRLYRFWGGRDWVKTLTSQVALDWIRRSLVGLPPLEPGELMPAPRAAPRT